MRKIESRIPVYRRFAFNISRLLAAAAAAAGVACTTAPPGTAPLQSTATVPAPAVTTGDSWTYRVRDGYTGLERGTQTLRVTESGKDRVVVAVSGANVAGEELHIYDREWGWLRRPAMSLPTFDYQPSYQAFAFPLAPGKTWRERLVAIDPRNQLRFPAWLDARVVGWERVKVAAGEFDTIRVRRFAVINYLEQTVRGQSQFVEQEWYAPAVKQAVRRETSGEYLSFLAGGGDSFLIRVRGDDGGGPQMVRDDWLIWELESYQVR